MNKQLVSVIVPTHNRDKLLQESILSVYRQTYRPIELVVVDDGSTDKTEEVIKTCIEQFEEGNFKIIFLQQNNNGAASARNMGFSKSSGHFIQFLDSDDILLPQKIEDEVKILREQEYDLVYSKAQFVNESLIPIKGKFWGKALTGTYLDYFNFPWQTSCALYRRETILQGGAWVEDLSINQDWEFNIRYILLGFEIGFIDRVHALYRVHSSDRVGLKLETANKIDSKVKSTILIRDLVIEKSLLNNALDKRYFKRLIFCALLYGSIQAKPQKRQLLLYIEKNFLYLSLHEKSFLKLLKYSLRGFDHFVLKVYSSFV